MWRTQSQLELAIVAYILDRNPTYQLASWLGEPNRKVEGLRDTRAVESGNSAHTAQPFSSVASLG